MKRTTLIMAAAVLVAACSDSTSPGNRPAVSLSFAARAATGAAPVSPGLSMSPADEILTDGQNELIITKAEVVLREIELKRVETVDCDALEPDDDECEKFQTAPILLDLPLDGGVAQDTAILVPAGMYDEVEFDIHKVSNDDPEDAQFREDHPDMVGKSIRVQGTFNTQPFTYETDLNVEQEFDLSPPLDVTDGSTSTNVTVLLDLDQWFRDLAGNLVNPQSGNKGGDNEGLIKENIKQSIEAFEDHDSDGEPDDS